MKTIRPRLTRRQHVRIALACVPFVAHAVWMAASHHFRPENAIELLLVAVAFLAGPRLRRLLAGAYPLALVGLFYDSMKAVESVGVSPETVHLCDLRAHELALFGVSIHGHRGTFHDWLQAHSSPLLDRICAIPYGTFIFVCIACAAYLYVRDYPRMVRFTWCFFALNMAGFLTYHLYPAAPPWYYHAHGCIIDVHASASEGPNLARVDAWLGVPYFARMYGRATDVFGAMPSLHCAYACLVALEGWAAFRAPWRAASVGFFALMCFSAVYLDHHWVLDAMAGITYCTFIVAAARILMPIRLGSSASRPGARGRGHVVVEGQWP